MKPESLFDTQAIHLIYQSIKPMKLTRAQLTDIRAVISVLNMDANGGYVFLNKKEAIAIQALLDHAEETIEQEPYATLEEIGPREPSRAEIAMQILLQRVPLTNKETAASEAVELADALLAELKRTEEKSKDEYDTLAHAIEICDRKAQEIQIEKPPFSADHNQGIARGIHIVKTALLKRRDELIAKQEESE